MKQEMYPAWSRIPFSVKFEFFPLWCVSQTVSLLSLLSLSLHFYFRVCALGLTAVQRYVVVRRNIHIIVTSVFLMLASVLGLIEEFGYKTVSCPLPPLISVCAMRVCGGACACALLADARYDV
jgi:hypothetical protein